MGVTSLWLILSKVGELKDLTEGGETLAVDLSAWIHQANGANIPGKSSSLSSSSYFIARTIFYRTLDLLKSGMKLIFVLDGTAPDLKLKTLQKRGSTGKAAGSRFKHRDKEVLELLRSLGIPVVESPGEAEKMCAYLNATQMVDAVITDDSDALLYGAKKIYRNYDFKDKTATSISLQDIERELNLTQRDLIGFALLSGCDYSPGGVKGVGLDQIKEIFKEMRQHGSDIDVLERICDWKRDKHMQHLDKVKVKLERVDRSAHCSQCQHTGNRSSHNKRGCDVCETEKGCEEDSGKLCDCSWHEMEHQLEPYKKEMGARDKALRDSGFTQRCREIKEEFMDTEKEMEQIAKKSVTSTCPNLTEIVRVVSKTLKLEKADVVTKMVPMFVNMQLRREFSWKGLNPLSIEKTCTRNHVECYQTSWSKIEEDGWTVDSTYSVDVEQNLFEERHADIVSKFKEISAKKKSSTPHKQRPIQDMLSPENVGKTRRLSPAKPRKGNNSKKIRKQGLKRKLCFDGISVNELAGPSSVKPEDEDSHNTSSTSNMEASSVNSDGSGDRGQTSSQSQMVQSSLESNVQSYDSEDLFGSDEDDEKDSTNYRSSQASVVKEWSKDEDPDCEIVEEVTSEKCSSKRNVTARVDVTENKSQTVKTDILKCDVSPKKSLKASKDLNGGSQNESHSRPHSRGSGDPELDAVEVVDSGSCSSETNAATSKEFHNSDESSESGHGKGAQPELRSIGLGDSESDSGSDSSCEVHSVDIGSRSCPLRTNATTLKDHNNSNGSSVTCPGNVSHSGLHPSGLEDSESCSSSGVRPIEVDDCSSSSNDVIICQDRSVPHRRSSSSSDIIIVQTEKVERVKEHVPNKRKAQKVTNKTAKKSKKTPKGNQKSIKDFFSNRKK